jgi:hypothetical protein
LNNKTHGTLVAVLIIFAAFILASCSSGKSDAAAAIEAYIQALGNKDINQISNISCADWAKSALVEVDSFTAVNTKVENLSCQEAGQDGSDTLVTCKGDISLDYGGEAQQIDLSGRTYIARQEAGEWRMCGYK